MTNSEYLLNVFLEQMEVEVFAEHQDDDTCAVAGSYLDLFSFDDDCVDVGVPDDFDFTCGG